MRHTCSPVKLRSGTYTIAFPNGYRLRESAKSYRAYAWYLVKKSGDGGFSSSAHVNPIPKTFVEKKLIELIKLI